MRVVKCEAWENLLLLICAKFQEILHL